MHDLSIHKPPSVLVRVLLVVTIVISVMGVLFVVSDDVGDTGCGGG